MFETINKQFGKLDGLVNNAVYDKECSLEELTVEEFRKELEVNVIGRWLCVKYSIPLMKNSSMSRIVNISSSKLSNTPAKNFIAYCTSEAANVMLTKCSALELTEKYNIKANTVALTTTLTPLVERTYSRENLEKIISTNPSRRLGTIDDATNSVLFLLSEEADFINGETLNVNGGNLLK